MREGNIISRIEPSTPAKHDAIHGTHDVSLRPVHESDLEDLLRWRRDPEVVAFSDEPPADLDEAQEEFLDAGTAPLWRFVVEWEGRGVGSIGYSHPYADTDYLWTAGIDIFIGEPEARNRDVGPRRCGCSCGTCSR